jgi:hypothetical protein
LSWQVAGFGDFNGDATTDMMLRDSSTGAFEVYGIANNGITSAANLGAVGLDWQVAGFGPVHGAGASDMVLRNSGTGAFEVYDIANYQITAAANLGQVGLDWQLGGFAVDPPTGSAASADDVTQLAQAMASFGAGSGAGSDLTMAVLAADTSLQPLLTMPQNV